MPKRLLDTASLPTLVQERLSIWGRCIRTQRLRQRIAAADFCVRIGISEATLRRLERGDPGAGAADEEGRGRFRYAPSYADAGLTWAIDPVNLTFRPDGELAAPRYGGPHAEQNLSLLRASK